MESNIPLISLCMIVRNEEKNLERCLKSVKDYVDEIIVVDTGSTDQTPQIAKKYGAKVFSHEWKKSFAEARNQSLSYARGKWILVLDADEELPPATGSSLHRLAGTRNVEAYTFTIVSPSSTAAGAGQHKNINIRMFKNKPGYKFEGALHEQIKPSILRENSEKSIVHTHLLIYHYGYCRDLVDKKKKTLRNIEILKEMLASNPGDNFSRYNLGVSYYVLGDFERAIEQFSLAAPGLNISSGYAPVFFRNYTIALMDYGEYDRALQTVQEGIAHFPDYPDLYFLKGDIMMGLGMLMEAQKCFEQCLAFKKINPQYPTTEGVLHYLPLENLSHVFEYMSDLEKAIACQVKSLKINNANSMNSFLRLGRLLKRRMKEGEKIVSYLLEQFTSTSFKKDYLPFILFDIGEYQLCIYVINDNEETPALTHLKARALLRSGRFKEAKSTLGKLPESFPKFQKSLWQQCICDWMQTPPANAEKQIQKLHRYDPALVRCCRKLNNHFLNATENSHFSNSTEYDQATGAATAEGGDGNNRLEPASKPGPSARFTAGGNEPPETAGRPGIPASENGTRPALEACTRIAFEFLILGAKKRALETLKALGINNPGQVYFLLGRQAFDQQYFGMAEELLLQAIKHNYKNGELYYMLAEINAKRRHFTKAFSFMEQAAAMEENNPKYCLGLMNILVQKQILIIKDGFNFYKTNKVLKKYFFLANNLKKKLQLISDECSKP